MAKQPENKSEIIFYRTEDGRTRLEVQLVNESVWLSLNQMAELFQRDKSVISKHIKNVFAEGELLPEPVVANFATTAADGMNQRRRNQRKARCDWHSGIPSAQGSYFQNGNN
jgi:hypothetical protein